MRIDVIFSRLSIQHRNFGTINIYTKYRTSFSEREKAFMRAIAATCASVIEQFEKSIEKKEQVKILSSLLDKTKQMNSIYDQKALFELILEEAIKLTDSTEGSIRMRHGDELIIAVSKVNKESLRKRKLQIGVGVSGRCALTGEIEKSGNIPADPELLEICPDCKSEIAVPIKIDNRVEGIINIEHRDNFHHFTDYHANLLTMFANQAAIAIRNLMYLNELKALHEINAELTNVRNIKKLNILIVKKATELLPAHIAAIYKYNKDNDKFEPGACFFHDIKCKSESGCIEGSAQCNFLKETSPREDGLARRVMKEGQLLIERNQKELYPYILDKGIKIVAAAPLKIQNIFTEFYVLVRGMIIL